MDVNISKHDQTSVPQTFEMFDWSKLFSVSPRHKQLFDKKFLVISRKFSVVTFFVKLLNYFQNNTFLFETEVLDNVPNGMACVLERFWNSDWGFEGFTVQVKQAQYCLTNS